MTAYFTSLKEIVRLSGTILAWSRVTENKPFWLVNKKKKKFMLDGPQITKGATVLEFIPT